MKIRAKREEGQVCKILDNHRDMMLNFSTKDCNNAALSQSKELLEVIDCPALEESKAEVRRIFLKPRDKSEVAPHFDRIFP